MVLLLLASGHYTQRENWQNLKLSYVGTDKTLSPAAPANQYLHPDDLRIFKGIRGRRFVSLPWKGTVIGVATDNYTGSIKSGAISGGAGSAGVLEKHLRGDINCNEDYKELLERQREGIILPYLYPPVILCPHLEIVDRSAEGFYLLKFKHIGQ